VDVVGHRVIKNEVLCAGVVVCLFLGFETGEGLYILVVSTTPDDK
jgi:hypothetical protein